MKLIIATTALVVLAVAAVVSVAQAGPRFKDLAECKEFIPGKTCNECCESFNWVGTVGRLLFTSPGFRQCKCITQEEADRLHAEWLAIPPYKSVRSCSRWNYDSTRSNGCKDCCEYFKKTPTKGRPSAMVRGEHVCKCKSPKQEKSE